MKPTLLVLAAGMGSRYGGLKQIDAIGPYGQTLIEYAIYDAIRAGFGKVVSVINKSVEKEFNALLQEKLKGKIKTGIVYQEPDMVPKETGISPQRQKPWGTAHAVWVARKVVRGPFVVINADDYYGPSNYRAMADYLTAQGLSSDSDYCMLGYPIRQTLSGFGHVSRGICESTDEGFLASVVERTKIASDSERIYFIDENKKRVPLDGSELVSMNIWGFTPSVFEHLGRAVSNFIRLNADRPKAELYIPAAVNSLVARGKATVKILTAVDRWFGVTYKADKPLAIARIKRLMAQGVYPADLWG